MKPDYKNWLPKGYLKAFKYVSYLLCLSFLAIFVYIFIRKANGKSYLHWLSIVDTILLVAFIVVFYFYKKFTKMHKMFSFEDENSISSKVIDYVSSSIELKDGDKILDVGCGSGALSIAFAKKNPNCQVDGVDKWGASYKDFNKSLCESNAKIEGVSNASFNEGNAVKLDIPDETYDAVVSNYVYHNIPGNRQEYLLETLRVLKKGGQFAIHDIFVKVKYGDINKFRDKLLEMGYQEVEFIDTTDNKAMTLKEAKASMLNGSKLLIGIK